MLTDTTQCFWCVYERVENQTYIPDEDESEVVTYYEGTPVCAQHACWIGRELVKQKDKVQELMTAARM